MLCSITLLGIHIINDILKQDIKQKTAERNNPKGKTTKLLSEVCNSAFQLTASVSTLKINDKSRTSC